MITIREVLQAKGYTVYETSPDATIDHAVIEMCRVKAGALLVVDRLGRPVGILSERDLLIRVLLAHLDPARTIVGDVMTTKIVSVEEDETIEGAMRLMTDSCFRHLPVVRARLPDRVIGLVSMGDLVRAAAGDHEYELRVLHEYVEGRYPG